MDKKKPKILVIGSANMDMVIRTDHFPTPGETIMGGEFSLIPGGKGANQAVASARLGGDVCFITQLGKDIFGDQNLENFKREGIDTSFIKQNPNQPTGVALITVDKSGENTIIVAPGANHTLSVAEISSASNAFQQADIVLVQLEVPVPIVVEACQKAYGLGKRVILNPAPAMDLPESLFRFLYLIVPNETEAEFLTGIKVIGEASAYQAASRLRNMGVQRIIITMGGVGAFLFTDTFQGIIPTTKVEVKDTTAAGDTFCGALAVALGNGKNIQEAVAFALKAATLSVQRFGAQTSIPYLEEL
ncbi:ribokinase [Aquiflexum gelatinilyticum]|uniref:ribokinase n=1 Tax=Aquiflexum gelatinilyticum TaxID=2961943 RepID=UPI0021692C02|nr:ribokinase [Aquiflexum gelatinilyticum]MCS4435818.1 ribokinase [Aquiflexum gelatinilyticum]